MQSCSTDFSQLTIDKPIGFGSFGTVFKSKDEKSGTEYAMKICPIAGDGREKDFEREILIHSLIDHPLFPRYYGCVKYHTYVVMVQELCVGKNLNDYLDEKETLTESAVLNILKQILDAVLYLHRNNIIHRDIKLENIILASDGTIKICDFGFARFYDHGVLINDFCGSFQYISPEIANQTPYLGPENDIWTIGICLLKLCVGNEIFYEASNGGRITSLYNIFEKRIESNLLKMLLKQVLQNKPTARPSLEAIYKMLKMEIPTEKQTRIKYLDFVVINQMKLLGYSEDLTTKYLKKNQSNYLVQIYRMLHNKIYKSNVQLLNDTELNELYKQNLKKQNFLSFCCPQNDCIELLFYEHVTFEQLAAKSNLRYFCAYKNNSVCNVTFISVELGVKFSLYYRFSNLYSVRFEKVIGNTSTFIETVQTIITSFNKYVI